MPDEPTEPIKPEEAEEAEPEEADEEEEEAEEVEEAHPQPLSEDQQWRADVNARLIKLEEAAKRRSNRATIKARETEPEPIEQPRSRKHKHQRRLLGRMLKK